MSLQRQQDIPGKGLLFPLAFNFFFFFVMLQLELRAYNLSHSTIPFFVKGLDRVSQTCPGWLQIVILLISAS
jgi:hypothetical protein